jgi:alpha-tubulin suppressor-like RCC1 family protein
MDSDDEDEEILNPRESVPGLVEGFPDDTVIAKIACGDSVTVAVTGEGKVYAWGTFRVFIPHKHTSNYSVPKDSLDSQRHNVWLHDLHSSQI